MEGDHVWVDWRIEAWDQLTGVFSNRTHQCTGSWSKFIGMDALLEWHDGRFQGHRPHPSDPQPSGQPSFVSAKILCEF